MSPSTLTENQALQDLSSPLIAIYVYIFFGWLFARWGWADASHTSTLNNFLFKLVIPFLVFSELGTAGDVEWDWKFVAATFIINILVVLFCAPYTYFVTGGGISGFVVNWMLSGWANTLVTGFILIPAAFPGKEGTILVVSAIQVTLWFQLPVWIFLFGMDKALKQQKEASSEDTRSTPLLDLEQSEQIQRGSAPYTGSTSGSEGDLRVDMMQRPAALVFPPKIQWALIAWNALIAVLKNPLTIGTFLGILWGYGLPPKAFPTQLHYVCSQLGNAMFACALFSVGVFTFSIDIRKSFEKQRSRIFVLLFVKLIAMPFCIYYVGLAIGVDGEKIVALVLLFGFPTANSAYILCKVHGEGEIAAMNLIIGNICMLISVPATVAILL